MQAETDPAWGYPGGSKRVQFPWILSVPACVVANSGASTSIHGPDIGALAGACIASVAETTTWGANGAILSHGLLMVCPESGSFSLP